MELYPHASLHLHGVVLIKCRNNERYCHKRYRQPVSDTLLVQLHMMMMMIIIIIMIVIIIIKFLFIYMLTYNSPKAVYIII
jgi:heme/copper-type cytochrome/quinol oxidase subunit 2